MSWSHIGHTVLELVPKFAILDAYVATPRQTTS